MAMVSEHYENLLADYYSWLFGDYSAKVADCVRFYTAREIRPLRSGVALDLGAGSGFHSVALAEVGFTVTAIDLSRKLLDELESRRGDLPITTMLGDMVEKAAEFGEPVEVCACMGDTLPHLPSFEEVKLLVERVHSILAPQGLFIVTYRDLSFPLSGVDRFIPVKSDENTIFTCFLEYAANFVTVHDLVHLRSGNGWELRKSCYRKLRLPLDSFLELLEMSGFIIEEAGNKGGMITLIAAKA